MKRSIIKKIIIVALLLSGIKPLTAQYLLDDKLSFVYVSGTSTLHNWTATVKKMKGSLQAEVEGSQISKITSARIVIPVTALESGKKAMDKTMYKALKEKEYHTIVYQLKNSTLSENTISVTGELTIAGVTNIIETTVTPEEIGNYIKIKGDVKLKMSDFMIEPPEFLGGAFKTGDEITVNFSFTFGK